MKYDRDEIRRKQVLCHFAELRVFWNKARQAPVLKGRGLQTSLILRLNNHSLSIQGWCDWDDYHPAIMVESQNLDVCDALATMIHELGHLNTTESEQRNHHGRQWRNRTRQVASFMGFKITPELMDAKTKTEFDLHLTQMIIDDPRWWS